MFFMDRRSLVENRIRGIEYECAINTVDGSWQDVSGIIKTAMSELAGKGYIRHFNDRQAKQSTANCGVVYNDLDHLEMCTPSFVSPMEAVAYDKAMEIYAYIASSLASKRLGANVIVHKTNSSTQYGWFTDSSVSYATHSSVCMSRKSMLDWGRVKRAFVPYIVSRILFTGAGDIVNDSFVISPRAMYVDTISSEDTMKFRGIINERNSREWLVNEKGQKEFGWSRNYVNPNKYMRWHDIHYEGLRCDWNIFIRDVWESYMATAFEEGLLDDAPIIHRPVEAFKSLSRDIDGKWKLKGEVNGEVRQIDVVDDVLGYYHEKIGKLFESREKGPWDEVALKNIDLLMKSYGERNLERFKDYGIDWLTKMDYLKVYDFDAEKLKGISKEKAKEAKRICNAFSWLDSKVLYYLPEEKRGSKISEESECLFDPQASIKFLGMDEGEVRKVVSNAFSRPSEHTRDWFSWSVMRKFKDRPVIRRWDSVHIGNSHMILGEPFMLNREEIGELESINTVEDLVEMVRKKYPEYVQE